MRRPPLRPSREPTRLVKCCACNGAQTVGDQICSTCGGAGQDWRERKAPIKRTTPLPRGTKPIRAHRRDPKSRRFAKHRDPLYASWIKTLDCLICWRLPVDPAHVIPQSLGSDDRENLVPLCRLHHDEQEGRTAEFEQKYGLDLTAEALRLDREYAGVFQ